MLGLASRKRARGEPRIVTEATDAELIRMLEERLLDPQARRDAAFLDQVLADDFIEFGRSGAVCDKAGAIEALLAQADYPGARLSVFSARALAPDVMLVVYRSARADGSRAALRSSIWRHETHGWRLVFHQGTPTSG